jgi:hypothetical protein
MKSERVQHRDDAYYLLASAALGAKLTGDVLAEAAAVVLADTRKSRTKTERHIQRWTSMIMLVGLIAKINPDLSHKSQTKEQ